MLTLRKAGDDPLEYLKITIEQGRVTGLTVEAGDAGGSAELLEHLSFSFNKISIDYVPQGKDGLAKGGLNYTDQWGEA